VDDKFWNDELPTLVEEHLKKWLSDNVEEACKQAIADAWLMQEMTASGPAVTLVGWEASRPDADGVLRSHQKTFLVRDLAFEMLDDHLPAEGFKVKAEHEAEAWRVVESFEKIAAELRDVLQKRLAA
jgi:hypothetical protein